MSPRYDPFSGKTRVVAATAAVLVTVALFAGVAMGLTGTDASRLWAAGTAVLGVA